MGPGQPSALATKVPRRRPLGAIAAPSRFPGGIGSSSGGGRLEYDAGGLSSHPSSTNPPLPWPGVDNPTWDPAQGGTQALAFFMRFLNHVLDTLKHFKCMKTPHRRVTTCSFSLDPDGLAYYLQTCAQR